MSSCQKSSEAGDRVVKRNSGSSQKANSRNSDGRQAPKRGSLKKGASQEDLDSVAQHLATAHDRDFLRNPRQKQFELLHERLKGCGKAKLACFIQDISQNRRIRNSRRWQGSGPDFSWWCKQTIDAWKPECHGELDKYLRDTFDVRLLAKIVAQLWLSDAISNFAALPAPPRPRVKEERHSRSRTFFRISNFLLSVFPFRFLFNS